MKRIILLLLVVLPATILAQANYRDGYIIKNNGDTLKGYINYQEWEYSPLKVEFKINRTDAQTEECDPNTIKGFGVNGSEAYTSFVGLASMSKNIFPDIPNSLDTTQLEVGLFTTKIATGDHLTLYLNTDVGRNSFFIAEKNGATTELKYYDYYGTEKNDEITDNLYRGQLILYIYKYNNGDKNLLAKVADEKYEERDLRDIVDKINNVVTAAKVDSLNNTNEKSIVRFFVGTGINSINSSGQQIFRPKFDIGIDIFKNPDIQQFVFRTEIGFSSFGAHLTSTATGSANAVDVSYSGSWVTIVPQILLNVYNTEKFKAYIDGGLGFRLASYSTDASNGTLYVDNTPPKFYLPLQVGVMINKWLEISFTYSTLSTTAFLPSLELQDKLSTTLGVKIFLK